MTLDQNPAEEYREIAGRFTRLVDAVPDERTWARPAPPEGWTARDVVRHMVETQREMLTRPHAVRRELQEKGEQTDMYWGYFWAELGHSFGPQFDRMTLAEVAHAEFSAVERILSRALPH